jgi:heat shock protein HspQ
MVSSKFGIGQQVRHCFSGVLGVIIDVDPEYSLEISKINEVDTSGALCSSPWYHVVMESEDGDQVYTYIAETQLSCETSLEHPEQPAMDELAASIRRQLQVSRLCH